MNGEPVAPVTPARNRFEGAMRFVLPVVVLAPVSYTHLTLPTILRV